ncbi:type I restriction endonuclease subunit R [Flaviaesturariibacter flavus]|uniref:Type I restriction enzyme endonuclease subunit n=1 Tax=Flaviaesturariibacter flavus TaxID=2502780 RepID=A0A4R1BL50_9BACT|nr:type I restriction endonuclease subunit R [Flaviaesturariibacter flavus]TCJ18140.1 type I restriction endonuclease subunit R [Flaviaesturariibacter flavus]
MRELDIENQLIGKLADLKYTHRPDIRDRAALEQNFRKKFQDLNRVTLSDAEFSRLRDEIVNPDVFATAKLLRQRNTFIREDGTPLQYTLVNIKDWCKNDFEVVNQLRMNTHNSHHRYDVLLLMNGIPVLQAELKTLEVSPRRAMQQIVDYKADPGNGYTNSLLCFVQLFVVSNRTNTCYFANNRAQHFNFSADEQFLPVYQLAAEDNKKITHLDDFAEKFLAKCTLAQMISRYMVLVESEQKLLVMRPYQVYAVKEIVRCIEENRGNGYIWHTTGSGKTLTSFKASTLLKEDPNVEKCLFVVDRKDLDRQTRDEFNKFQPGCVEENTNTEALVTRLLSEDYADKVIVTTIQKLGLALDPANPRNYKDRLEPLRQKRVVFIFDECHRSQFGENHKAIKEFFPKAQLFGFTGTPIFEDNAINTQAQGDKESWKTTEDIFQKCLHRYTITHAIEDRNVLRFHVDYFKPEVEVTTGSWTHRAGVANHILNKHDDATHGRRFNAILATASINEAIEYYDLFQKLQQKRLDENESYQPLHIACVFSPPAEGNKDVQQLQEDLPQEQIDNQVDPEGKKAALKGILDDYNRQYGTAHRLADFDGYYKDIQQRIKDQQYPNSDYPRAKKIDLVIVVDMLLTGFDARYLNTLYVDKNLKHHGLIQAFSRTNRVLNDTKPYGNVLDFRRQKDAVDAAIKLFSGESGSRAREIWLVEPAPVVLQRYAGAVAELAQMMGTQGLACAPEEVANLKGDAARADFINRFKEVQRLKTQLDQYTDLSEADKTAIDTILPPDALRSFRSAYIETAKRLRDKQGGKEPGVDPKVEQLDFEFVLFASAIIDYDYIMGLIAAWSAQGPKKQKMTREDLVNLLGSSANLMEERDDIVAYIDTLQAGAGLSEEAIRGGYQQFKTEKHAQAVLAVAAKNGLEAESLQAFVSGVLNRMVFDGAQLTELLAPLDLGWKARTQKEQVLMNELIPILKKRAGGREIAGLKAYE